MTPSVSVVVPARDCAGTLAAAVASAVEQRGVEDLEVVIAVGPSADATHETAESLARQWPRVRVVDNPAGTTPGALNAAIAASTGQVVVRVDAHAVLPDGYVATALEALADPRVGNVGGRQQPVAEGGFAAAVASAMRSPVGAGGATYRTGERPGPVDTVYLGVFRRVALDEVGCFDPLLLRNQDYELNVRLRKAGWQVRYDPRLVVRYRPRDSVPGLARQYFQYGQWKRVVLRLHPDSVRLRQTASPALVVALLLGLVAGPVLGWWPLAVLGAAYGSAIVAGALVADWRRFPLVAVAFVTMHLAWGAGFLVGVRGPRPA